MNVGGRKLQFSAKHPPPFFLQNCLKNVFPIGVIYSLNIGNIEQDLFYIIITRQSSFNVIKYHATFSRQWIFYVRNLNVANNKRSLNYSLWHLMYKMYLYSCNNVIIINVKRTSVHVCTKFGKNIRWWNSLSNNVNNESISNKVTVIRHLHFVLMRHNEN